MKLIESKKGIKNFFLYRGEEVLSCSDKILIGKQILPAKDNDIYQYENEVLFQKVKKKGEIYSSYHRFDGNAFVEEDFRYKLKIYYNPEWSCSYEYTGGNSYFSLKNKGNKYDFEFSSDAKYKPMYLDTKHEILLLYHVVGKSLLFYTPTGERLWEYKVEEGNQILDDAVIVVGDVVITCVNEKSVEGDKGNQILEDAVIVVDDVVVITCVNEKNRIVSVEGYNLSSGEKIWKVDEVEHCRKKYVQGPNKILYGLTSYHCKDHTTELRFTELDPFTGKVEEVVLREGEYWSGVYHTTIHGNKLFYVHDNWVENSSSLGVIDLETREVIEDFPLGVAGRGLVATPIVTDDKIYVHVRDLNELRIYENEFK